MHQQNACRQRCQKKQLLFSPGLCPPFSLVGSLSPLLLKAIEPLQPVLNTKAARPLATGCCWGVSTQLHTHTGVKADLCGTAR